MSLTDKAPQNWQRGAAGLALITGATAAVLVVAGDAVPGGGTGTVVAAALMVMVVAPLLLLTIGARVPRAVSALFVLTTLGNAVVLGTDDLPAFARMLCGVAVLAGLAAGTLSALLSAERASTESHSRF